MHRRTFAKVLGAGAALQSASPSAAQQGIKVGVLIHAGGAHLEAYFSALAATDEVAGVTLSDPGRQNVAEARKALGDKLGAIYDDPETLVKKEQPGMALVSMEAALAPPAIQSALEAGCHVMAEKPACVRIEDFERLHELAKANSLHLMLALANRLNPEVREARRLIREDKIGKIYGVEAHLIADQTRLTRPAYQQSWFAKRSRGGGGHLIWLGIHWLDLTMFLTNSDVVEVAGFTGVVGGQPLDVEDSAAVTMKFANGTFGTMTSGYYLDRGYHSQIKIWGSRGWLEIGRHGGVPLTWYSHDEQNPRIHRIEDFTGTVRLRTFRERRVYGRAPVSSNRPSPPTTACAP